MEPTPQKSLERVISQRAVQMSASLQCKTWVLGFFCGVCIAYLFLVAFTPYKPADFGVGFTNSLAADSTNSSSLNLEVDKNAGCNFASKEIGNSANFEGSNQPSDVKKAALLYSAWTALLDESKDFYEEFFDRGLNRTSLPRPPYVEDCKMNVEINKFLDMRGENGSLPRWSLWKGKLGLELFRVAFPWEEQKLQTAFQNANPPWVLGSDEDNFPLTRLVQRHLWIHQHPQNCKSPNLRFLVADWGRLPGFGIGAQLAGMAGLLAIAINENRILVTGYYNRADHGGCQGSSHAHWSCYFFPETPQECRDRANDLMKKKEAWDDHIITVKDNYTSKEIWGGRIPRVWGEPWNYLQPTTDVDGNLLRHHRKMDRRWWRAQMGWTFAIRPRETIMENPYNKVTLMRWDEHLLRRWIDGVLVRHSCTLLHQLGEKIQSESVRHSIPIDLWDAQALRYLMRFQSEYTCRLLNVARHSAFGLQAAEMVLRTLPGWPKESVDSSLSDIENFVWSNHKPWIPRPMLSMHVRMGDKACEMKVVEFENYMHLAERIRKKFPNLNSIWLSTEMQEVIDKTRLYPHWKFYYTNVTRQIGNMSMAAYEASLGRATSTNYPLVNFIMATDADFFIGALGSTWCFLIDGMRNTGGKVMAGYLSVNRDRFW